MGKNYKVWEQAKQVEVQLLSTSTWWRLKTNPTTINNRYHSLNRLRAWEPLDSLRLQSSKIWKGHAIWHFILDGNKNGCKNKYWSSVTRDSLLWPIEYVTITNFFTTSHRYTSSVCKITKTHRWVWHQVLALIFSL